MEMGSVSDGRATLLQSERSAKTHGLTAECRGTGGTAECPQTTDTQQRKKEAQVTYPHVTPLQI